LTTPQEPNPDPSEPNPPAPFPRKEGGVRGEGSAPPASRSAGEEARLDAPTPAPPARLGELDVCRGLAILAVLFIHVSGHFLPALHPAKSHAPPTWAWYALAAPNQALQWAVPCFLMLSALVNGLGLTRKPDLARYARRRVWTALLPYLLWSGVYVLVNVLVKHQAVPGPRHLLVLLQYGTAYFHLYFFVLVLELYVLLPLLVPLFRRRPPLWAVALGALALQAAVYALNRFVLPHRLQGTILWDVLPVALGLWLMGRAGDLPRTLARGGWAAGAVALGALCVYEPLALAVQLPHVAHAPVNTALFQAGEWLYTAGASLVALALAFAADRGALGAVLGYLGAESLAIYVMHPLAILALDEMGLSRAGGTRHVGVGLGFAIYYAACLTLPLAAAWAWGRFRATAAGARRPA
jgi:surface polysaccharide O-acyltransferase-like enzyme